MLVGQWPVVDPVVGGAVGAVAAVAVASVVAAVALVGAAVALVVTAVAVLLCYCSLGCSSTIVVGCNRVQQ